MKGYSLGDERPVEVISLSTHAKLVSRLQLIYISWLGRFSPRPSALPVGGGIVGPITLSLSESAATKNIAQRIGQDQSGSAASDSENERTREQEDLEEIYTSITSDDLRRLYGRMNRKDAAASLEVSIATFKRKCREFGIKRWPHVRKKKVNVSMFKGTCRQHRYYWWPCRIEKNEQEAFDATNNRAHLVKADQSGLTMSTSEKEDTGEALKRECITKSVLSLENLCQHYGVWFHTPDSNAWKPFEERQELQFHTPDSLARKSFEELNVLPLCKQSNCIRRVVPQRRLALKRWVRLKKSQDLPGMVQMNCSRGLTIQSASSLHGPIGLPNGGHNASLSKKKIVRKTFKRKCRAMSVSFEDHQQHFSCRCKGAVNSLGAKHICKQRGINLLPTAKRICGQHWIHQCPFRQDRGTMKGYTLGDERPVEVISLSTEGKLVSRLQLIYISWLGRFSPPPSVLPGGEIVGHIALSSSEFATTNSIAQRVGQDQGGSGAFGSENERTREQEDPEEINTSISSNDIRRHLHRRNRKDTAAILGISESTFKRKCREYGINRWPHVRKKKVGRPPDQQGEGNTSTARETPSHNVQTGMEGEPVGQNHEANVFQHVEGQSMQSTVYPDHNVFPQTQIISPQESFPEGHVFESINWNEHTNSLASHAEHFSDRHISGSIWRPPDQLEGETTQNIALPNPNALVCAQFQIASTQVLSENEDGRNSLAFLMGHVSESSNLAFPAYSDPAAPSQPVATILQTMPMTTHMIPQTGGFSGIFQLEGQLTQSTSHPNPNVLVPQEPQIASTQMLSENVGSLENWEEFLSLEEETSLGGHVSGSVNLTGTTCCDPSPSQQPVLTNRDMMPTTHVMSHLVAREDERSVTVKVSYRDRTIKLFQVPLTSRIIEVKEEVKKRLKLEPSNFDFEYKDEDGDWIFLGCDEDLTNHLQLFSNRVIRLLVVDSDASTKNICESCGSLKRKRQ